MAHFAKLDNNNKVIDIHVVDNSVLDSENEEQSGIFYLTLLWGEGNYKQTSYNGNFRVRYAQVGGSYDPERDAFIPKKGSPSWIFDETTLDWEPPIPRPVDWQNYIWDESIVNWRYIA